jgi:hypothetical protein
MRDGLVKPRDEGTPQCGPWSPLLSNILLDDLDKELERRGHAFCRNADDCNIHVRTEKAGERVMASLTRFLSGRLRLLLWRRWKKPKTKVKNLRKRGLDLARAKLCAGNGRGRWWNSGASRMNQAFSKKYFDELGFVSLLDDFQSAKNSTRTAVYVTVRTVG